jgi:hypothetical protein
MPGWFDLLDHRRDSEHHNLYRRWNLGSFGFDDVHGRRRAQALNTLQHLSFCAELEFQRIERSRIIDTRESWAGLLQCPAGSLKELA